MNWSDKVLADNSLSKPARQLADVIARNFAAFGQARFYDTDCCAFADLPRDEVRMARLELLRRGWLAELNGRARTGKPSYALRHDGRAVSDGEAA